MPARIADDVRLKIIFLYFTAQTEQQIANSVGVHVNTVRNVISELKAGNYPKFESYLPYLESLRNLSKRLDSSGITLEAAVSGLTILDGLTQLGVDPAELPTALDFFHRMSPVDLPIGEFVKIAVRITRLENQTGMTFEGLASYANNLESDIRKFQGEKIGLTQEVNGLQTRLTEANRSLQESLNRNQTTLTVLNEYAEDKKILNNAKLNIGDIKPVAELVRKSGAGNVLLAAQEMARLNANLGMTSTELVASYQQTIDLTRKGRTELGKIESTIKRARGELLQLREQIASQIARTKPLTQT